MGICSIWGWREDWRGTAPNWIRGIQVIFWLREMEDFEIGKHAREETTSDKQHSTCNNQQPTTINRETTSSDNDDNNRKMNEQPRWINQTDLLASTTEEPPSRSRSRSRNNGSGWKGCQCGGKSTHVTNQRSVPGSSRRESPKDKPATAAQCTWPIGWRKWRRWLVRG